VEGCCEHDNEPSGSVICQEFLDSKRLAASQEGLSSMELVSCLHKGWAIIIGPRIATFNDLLVSQLVS
jgi:hypothetical protein